MDIKGAINGLKHMTTIGHFDVFKNHDLLSILPDNVIEGLRRSADVKLETSSYSTAPHGEPTCEPMDWVALEEMRRDVRAAEVRLQFANSDVNIQKPTTACMKVVSSRQKTNSQIQNCTPKSQSKHCIWAKLRLHAHLLQGTPWIISRVRGTDRHLGRDARGEAPSLTKKMQVNSGVPICSDISSIMSLAPDPLPCLTGPLRIKTPVTCQCHPERSNELAF